MTRIHRAPVLSEAIQRIDVTLIRRGTQAMICLLLDIVEQVRTWATELRLTQQDLQRYCFYRGLQALTEGGRPEVEKVSHIVKCGRYVHTSSHWIMRIIRTGSPLVTGGLC